jgi:hypothetical protein
MRFSCFGPSGRSDALALFEGFSLRLEPFFGQVQGDLPAYGGVKG